MKNEVNSNRNIFKNNRLQRVGSCTLPSLPFRQSATTEYFLIIAHIVKFLTSKLPFFYLILQKEVSMEIKLYFKKNNLIKIQFVLSEKVIRLTLFFLAFIF